MKPQKPTLIPLLLFVTTVTILLCVTVLSSQAQTARIERIWLEHNVIQNGEKGIKIHAKFSIKDMLNKQGTLAVWFFDQNGNQLVGGPKKYSTSKGYLTTDGKFTPKYASATFNDFNIFFPYDALRSALRSPGKYDLQLKVGVFDHNANQLTQGTAPDFQYTLAGSQGQSDEGSPTNGPIEQKIIGGAGYHDPDNLIVQTIKGQVLNDITSDEMGTISAPNLYTFRTESGESIYVSFKNRLASSGGIYQINGSFQTAYYNGVKRAASVFYVTSYKKL